MRTNPNSTANNTQQKKTQFQPKPRVQYQFIPPLSHSFDVRFAAENSVEEAILMNHFIYWVNFNKANEMNLISGRTWMYQTQEEIASVYPYWNRKQVMRIIDKLVKKGFLLQANHHNNKYDKTAWYALGNEEMFPIVQKRTIDRPKSDNLYEDTKTNTQKTTAAKRSIVARPKPLACSPSVAVFSEVRDEEAQDRRKIPPKQEVPIPRSRVQTYKCLDSVDIPLEEKEWITKRYAEAAVEKSVAWAMSPQTSPRKSLAASLKWFLALPADKQPKTMADKSQDAQKNKERAKKIEDNYKSPTASMQALTTCACIDCGTTLIEIPYTQDNFLASLEQIMSKRGFKKIKL